MTETATPPLAELTRDWRDGRIKQALTQRLLKLRQAHDDIFRRGSYSPVDVVGDHAGHVIAFARAIQDRQVVVAIGRHFAALTDGGKHWPSGWCATLALPDRAHYIDALAGRDGTFSGRAELSNLFSEIPICVLVRQ